MLMVLFHFGYDLALFGYTSYRTTVDMEWITFRAVILSMFLLSVGMSAYLAYADTIDWKKLLKRSLILSLISVLISLGSYFIFPDQWIYFGVIHFITVATLTSLAFVRMPVFALFLGIAVIISYSAGYFRFDPILTYSVEHFHIPEHTVDVVSFTPWFGVVLIGIYLMHKENFGLCIQSNRVTGKISFLGRHSLAIYLVHQPVLFALFYMIKFIGK